MQYDKSRSLTITALAVCFLALAGRAAFAMSQEASDRAQGTLAGPQYKLNGNLYTNQVLRFSFKVPSELKIVIPSNAKRSVASTQQAPNAGDALLLLWANDSGLPVVGVAGFGTHTCSVSARKLADGGVTSTESLAKARLDMIRKSFPYGFDTLEIRGTSLVDGTQELMEIEAVEAPVSPPKTTSHWREYVMMRDGYELIFHFAGASSKDIESLSRSIRSLKLLP